LAKGRMNSELLVVLTLAGVDLYLLIF
jgi:hypothetical protein